MSDYLINSYSLGAPAFSPASVAGLAAWFDASDASSFTFSSGTRVSEWRDISGNGLHLSQANADNQPDRSGTQNGLATVVYDPTGTLDQLTRSGVSIPQPLTVVMACLKSGTGSGASAFGKRSTGEPTLYLDLGADYAMGAGTNLETSVDWTTNWVVITGMFNGSSSSMWANATLVIGTGSTVGSGGITTLRLSGDTASAGDAQWRGSYGEVIVYSAALSADDRTALYNYLDAKWAIP